MDGAGDRWAADAARSAESRGVRRKRWWEPFSDRSAALTRTSPLPPPIAACGRAEGGSGRGEVEPWTRARREGGGDDGAAAGRNAVAVAGDSARDAAEGFPGLFVEREDRRSGGGVGGFESKRRLAPPPGRPPPKRRALSATRRFQPGCGRETAAHPVVRSGGEAGLRVGASPSLGGFSMLERATTGARLSCAGDGGTEEGGLLLEAATANAGLVLPEKGGARPKATVVKPSDATIVQSSDNETLDGVVEVQKLVEVEIDATIVQSSDNETLDGVVEVQELEEGEIVASVTMDTVECTNKQALGGAVEVQELEKDEIAAPMHILESTNKQNFDGAVEVQESEEREIDATMDIVEAMNKNVLVGAVEGQGLEGKIVAKGYGQEPENCDIAAKGHGQKPVDGESATRYGQEPENGEIAAKGHGQEPVDGETVTRSDHIVQESQFAVYSIPRDSTDSIMRSKMKLAARKTLRPHVKANQTKSDHIVQESQFAVDSIPRDSTDSIMRSKMKLAARKTLRPHVKANQTKSDHIVQESQFAIDGISRDSTDGIMRSKITLTARKTVRPLVNANHMSPLTTTDRPFSTTRESFATMNKFKAAQSKHVPVNTASASALANKEKCAFKYLFVSKDKAKGKKAFYLEGDDILKAVAAHEGKLVLYVNVPSGVGSVWRHRQHVGHNSDARSKVRMMSRRFQFLCRFLALAVEQRLLEVPRVDLAADKVIKKFPDHTKHESIVGKVAGVEVGDKFLFRVELAIVGLHRPYRAGIDACKDNNGVLIALSVVASGGYLDELSSSGELIYTGSGGKAAGTAEQDGDQKLQRGNLALKNCITTKTPVRVIHGFKSRNREDGSHSKGKEISIFIYDGLYIVVGCWQEGIPGSRVFKYRLRRIPGQPELPLHVTKWIRKSALHPDRRPRKREAGPGGGSIAEQQEMAGEVADQHEMG